MTAWYASLHPYPLFAIPRAQAKGLAAQEESVANGLHHRHERRSDSEHGCRHVLKVWEAGPVASAACASWYDGALAAGLVRQISAVVCHPLGGGSDRQLCIPRPACPAAPWLAGPSQRSTMLKNHEKLDDMAPILILQRIICPNLFWQVDKLMVYQRRLGTKIASTNAFLEAARFGGHYRGPLY